MAGLVQAACEAKKPIVNQRVVDSGFYIRRLPETTKLLLMAISVSCHYEKLWHRLTGYVVPPLLVLFVEELLWGKVIRRNGWV